MRKLLRLFVVLTAAPVLHAGMDSSYSERSINLPSGAYDLTFRVNWTCDDFPQQSAPGQIQILDSSRNVIGSVSATIFRDSGSSFSVSLGSITDLGSSVETFARNGGPAAAELNAIWRLDGLAPGNYTIRFWDYSVWNDSLDGTTVWTSSSFVGESVPAANSAPTIAWVSAPAGAANAQPYSISAHGRDADGNLSEVRICKNGEIFASAGGGDGRDSECGSGTSDPGPQTITFTAWAIDSSGASSATISQTVTIEPPPPVRYALTTGASEGGSITPGGSYDSGTVVTVTASPDGAHEFAGWSGDAAGTANPIGLTLDRDKNVYATFTPRFVALTTGATDGGSVTSGGSYPAGSTVTISASPSATHRFIGWSGDARGTSSPIGVYLDRAKYVQAMFVEKASQTISFEPIGDRATNSPPFALSASASSGLPVTFTMLSGAATITGDQVQVNGPGAVTVQANQAGDEFYLPASVAQTFNVISPATLRFRGSIRTLLESKKRQSGAPLVIQVS